jgi:hypothetical protein
MCVVGREKALTSQQHKSSQTDRSTISSRFAASSCPAGIQPALAAPPPAAMGVTLLGGHVGHPPPSSSRRRLGGVAPAHSPSSPLAAAAALSCVLLLAAATSAAAAGASITLRARWQGTPYLLEAAEFLVGVWLRVWVGCWPRRGVCVGSVRAEATQACYCPFPPPCVSSSYGRLTSRRSSTGPSSTAWRRQAAQAPRSAAAAAAQRAGTASSTTPRSCAYRRSQRCVGGWVVGWLGCAHAGCQHAESPAHERTNCCCAHTHTCAACLPACCHACRSFPWWWACASTRLAWRCSGSWPSSCTPQR